MKLLVTGGAGFIGSNFVRYWLASHKEAEVVNLDKLTYAGNLENLRDVEPDPRYRLVRGDISDPSTVEAVVSEGFDAIINFAAESHVDRSIEDASVFIRSNIVGTHALLEAARRSKTPRYMQISTDEVYGSLGPSGHFTETSPLLPNSPYSASKASADLLVRAYAETYGMETVILRCSNNYGPYQFPEKLIPLLITNAIEDRPLPLYGDGLYIRDWIHVSDHNRAVEEILRNGRAGEIYNVGGGGAERTNLDVFKTILSYLEKPESLIRKVSDRQGHDRRYAMDYSKLENDLGWQPKVSFDEGIAQTIDWYVKNESWWRKVKSGEYRAYYRRMYENR